MYGMEAVDACIASYVYIMLQSLHVTVLTYVCMCSFCINYYFIHLQPLGFLLWPAVFLVAELHQMESHALMFLAGKVQ